MGMTMGRRMAIPMRMTRGGRGGKRRRRRRRREEEGD